jgi:signal transduction histidine kinase
METIEHLNSIIRIQEKSHEEQKTNIEVRLVVDKTMETLRTLIKQKNALVYNAVPKNLKFKSIPAYIDSILLNLISNALKYSRNEQNPQILISAAKSEHLLRISVTDNGVGMDLKKYGDRLFGMYKTFHGNRDAKGVGLFITKNQVEALGGRIKVESEINVGSKFIIELPDHEREVISCR